MGKIKKEKDDSPNSDLDDSQLSEKAELSHQDKLNFVSTIARPMASKKFTKKIYKLLKKACKHKHHIRNGLKSVQTGIRKGDRGLVFLAGDVTPIDIICHLPGVCEDLNIPYVYVPAKKDIGLAMGVKRNVLTAMILLKEDYKDSYEECQAIMKDLPMET